MVIDLYQLKNIYKCNRILNAIRDILEYFKPNLYERIIDKIESFGIIKSHYIKDSDNKDIIISFTYKPEIIEIYK